MWVVYVVAVLIEVPVYFSAFCTSRGQRVVSPELLEGMKRQDREGEGEGTNGSQSLSLLRSSSFGRSRGLTGTGRRSS